MSRLSRYAAVLAGFGVAALVFAVLFWLIGIEQILAALGRAAPGLVAAVGLLMFIWIVVQGLALWVVMSSLSVTIRALDAVLVFASTAFANNVTPFGQAGGEPIAALLLSDVSDAEYETSLAGIAGADAINFVPSTSLGLLGVGVYAATATLTQKLRFAAVSVVVFSMLLVTISTVIWYRREAVTSLIVRIGTPLLVVLGRLVPFVSTPGPERIKRAFDEFFGSIELLAADRRRLVLALALSTLGLSCQAIAMWLTFLALGTSIPIYVPFFVIPVGTMAAVGPTPGGLGGIESVHILLLTAATAVGTPIIAAAVVIHRIGGFWLTMVVGGGSMAALQARERL